MTTNTAGATSFDALLADIQGQSEDLVKSTAAADGDDERIEGAAAEGAGDGEGGDTDADGEGADKPVLGKSLTATDAEGNEHEAIDATDLLKSLIDRVETGESQTAAVLQASLGLIRQQGDLIKSLTSEVRALGGQGRGRKAVVTLHDKGAGGEDLTKALGGGEQVEEKKDGVTGPEFLTKALAAAKEGRIAYSDASFCETVINKGQKPPEHLIKAVLGTEAASA